MKTQICDAPGCGAPAMGDDVAFWSGNLCGRCWTDKYTPPHLQDPVAAYPVERRETIRWLRGVVASIMLMVAVPLLSGCAGTLGELIGEAGDPKYGPLEGPRGNHCLSGWSHGTDRRRKGGLVY